MTAAVDLPPPAETVVISAARLPPALSEPAFSSVRLAEAQIAPFDRLDVALRQVPALSTFRRISSLGANPTTQGVSLRGIVGSGAGRTLVTLDGVPQHDPFGGWVIWSSLPTEAIQGVSVVRGAGAGPYGAGALTGVIALEERSSGAAATAEMGGPIGQWRLAGSGVVDLGGVGIFLSGGKEHSDGWIPVSDEQRGAADVPLELDAWNAAARFQSRIGRTVIAMRVGAFGESRSSGLAGAEAETRGTTASLTAATAPQPGALGWRLQGWVRESNLRQTQVAVAADRNSTTPANNQYGNPAHSWGFNAALRGTSTTFEWETGVDVRATEGETQEQFRFMGGVFTRDRRAGGDTMVAGGYAEATWLSGPLLITGGARIDWWSSTDAHRVERNIQTGAITVDSFPPDKSGTLPTARGGIKYDLTQALYLRGAAYMGFRQPTLNELYRSFRVQNDITAANPDLKPEKLYGVEAAVGGGTDTGFNWEGTVFYNVLNDSIANVTLGFGPFTDPIEGFIPAGGSLRQRANVARIDALGVEAHVEQRWEMFGVRLAASYTDAEMDGGTEAPQLTGLRPAQAPQWAATAGIDWYAPYGFGLHLDFRYEGERFEDDLNLRPLDAAFTVDVRLDYQLTDNISVFGAVDNLFNADVQTRSSGPPATPIYEYGPPQLWRIGLSYRR
jgi:outer membrane receptor protein involved in Fe transport